MADAHFINYSSAAALEFALKLANALASGPPFFPDALVPADPGGQLAGVRTAAAGG
jgi:hypothetical protein